MENFEDVRRLPTGRAAIFVPQLMVERRFMEKPEEAKRANLNFNDVIATTLSNLQIPSEHHMNIQILIDKIDRKDERDPWVLCIAAYLRIISPNGISGVGEIATSGQIATSNVGNFVRQFIPMIEYKKNVNSGTRTSDPELEVRVVSDVLSYYELLNMAD